MLQSLKRAIGRRLANYLSRPLPGYRLYDLTEAEALQEILQPGDILLVEGNTRISTAIKFLTQSTWSHACLYVGSPDSSVDVPTLLEADLNDGVILVPLSKYDAHNLRICRPVGLSEEQKKSVLDFATARLGYHYDLRHVFDLMRYLIQTPAVPPQYRRRMIALGSGEPTRAICSTLIAQAFQSIHYPIIPRQTSAASGGLTYYSKRHFSHFVPRDFDVSPYFQIVKPTLEKGFNPDKVQWNETRAGISADNLLAAPLAAPAEGSGVAPRLTKTTV